MEEPEVVEHFFGVYLLYCMNPKFKGRTYIGYTVDPKRRIKQHNAGKDHGGAWRTSNRGPWKMVLIVHGFPNSTAALRFEWAWQHPHSSRRLKHIPKKKSRQTKFEFCLTVLSEMLNVGPWHRLPLTVRWLDHEFWEKHSSLVSPPMHMPISHGKVISRKVKRTEPSSPNEETADRVKFCAVCGVSVEEDDMMTCVKPKCSLVAHIICLADTFRNDGMILPVEGSCPKCKTSLLWGDLVRKKIGCYQNLRESDCSSDSDEEIVVLD